LTDSIDDAAEPRRHRLSAAALTLAAAIPVAPIIAGVLISSGNGHGAPGRTSRQYLPVPSPTSTAASLTPRPHDNLPPGSGSLVALVLHGTALRASPAGHVIKRIGTHTSFGSPEALWVLKHTPKWLGVISADAGNGRIGWISRSAAALTRVNWELRVSLSSRTVTVLRSGRLVHRYTVAIGKPSAPTPTGRFAVTDRLRTGNPTGPYGCCILALSAQAPHAIQGWNGGNRIAIHSTPETSSIGLPVSHGCLRLTLAEGAWLLDHIPLGTPTIIST
jgi:lipoprotein-anchoring transpeptidase ErfK/SrfK